MAINKYNTPEDLVDKYIKHEQRLRSLERNMNSVALSTTFNSPDPPWPSEAPNGDHSRAVGALWINSNDNTLWRWNNQGQWTPLTPVPDVGAKSFWYLATGIGITGAGVTNDIASWVPDGDMNSPLIHIDNGQDVTLVNAGLYRISVGITYPVNATGRRYMQVFTGTSGGTSLMGDWRGTSSTGVVSPQCSKVRRFNAGDIFRVTAAQDSGSTLTLLAGSDFSYLQVEYEGP